MLGSICHVVVSHMADVFQVSNLVFSAPHQRLTSQKAEANRSAYVIEMVRVSYHNVVVRRCAVMW